MDPLLKIVIVDESPVRAAILEDGLREAGFSQVVHIEGTNNLLARVKRPCALKTWGETLAKTKGPKRARVAVARKLAILLHKLWLTETEFCWG